MVSAIVCGGGAGALAGCGGLASASGRPGRPARLEPPRAILYATLSYLTPPTWCLPSASTLTSSLALHTHTHTAHSTQHTARPPRAPPQHFIGNDLEGWEGVTRHTFDANITERDLRDSFLPPFEACVREGGALAVMCSYNSLNGLPACVNKPLLTGLLRGELGFAGMVVTDCTGEAGGRAPLLAAACGMGRLLYSTVLYGAVRYTVPAGGAAPPPSCTGTAPLQDLAPAACQRARPPPPPTPRAAPPPCRAALTRIVKPRPKGPHFAGGDKRRASALAVQAGTDMACHLFDMLQPGDVSQRDLDAAVRRVLHNRVRQEARGSAEGRRGSLGRRGWGPWPQCKGAWEESAGAWRGDLPPRPPTRHCRRPGACPARRQGHFNPLSELPFDHLDGSVFGRAAHRDTAREIAAKGTVLLKNAEVGQHCCEGRAGLRRGDGEGEGAGQAGQGGGEREVPAGWPGRTAFPRPGAASHGQPFLSQAGTCILRPRRCSLPPARPRAAAAARCAGHAAAEARRHEAGGGDRTLCRPAHLHPGVSQPGGSRPHQHLLAPPPPPPRLGVGVILGRSLAARQPCAGSHAGVPAGSLGASPALPPLSG